MTGHDREVESVHHAVIVEIRRLVVLRRPSVSAHGSLYQRYVQTTDSAVLIRVSRREDIQRQGLLCATDAVGGCYSDRVGARGLGQNHA